MRRAEGGPGPGKKAVRWSRASKLRISWARRKLLGAVDEIRGRLPPWFLACGNPPLARAASCKFAESWALIARWRSSGSGPAGRNQAQAKLALAAALACPMQLVPFIEHSRRQGRRQPRWPPCRPSSNRERIRGLGEIRESAADSLSLACPLGAGGVRPLRMPTRNGQPIAR